jgi:DNA-binding response OmpR family regulator
MLDLMLPFESGWDFLHERRADPLLAPVPVVVVSAAPQDLLREASHLGADGLMSKPFDLDALTALVRSFIG